jgi:hypothetical protein
MGRVINRHGEWGRLGKDLEVQRVGDCLAPLAKDSPINGWQQKLIVVPLGLREGGGGRGDWRRLYCFCEIETFGPVDSGNTGQGPEGQEERREERKSRREEAARVGETHLSTNGQRREVSYLLSST